MSNPRRAESRRLARARIGEFRPWLANLNGPDEHRNFLYRRPPLLPAAPPSTLPLPNSPAAAPLLAPGEGLDRPMPPVPLFRLDEYSLGLT
ncbi:hypothetical protein HPP92_005829 [Vanilla planifolia]|uniref:Uncharacterized protein n=1 Tax=Vanilla planifolia TaxID=51239 RepID=A0A835RUR9_VANPL|nr:hypothetical protein HPP92_005829 [Vanilla planifolia]